MGCDIHMHREKRVDGKWLTADEWVNEYGDGLSIPFAKRFHERNYNLFAVLAGVRERETPVFTFAPRGMPVSLSAEVSAAAEAWGGDGHSHSYLYLHELQDLAALLSSRTQTISGMKNRDELAALHAPTAPAPKEKP